MSQESEGLSSIGRGEGDERVRAMPIVEEHLMHVDLEAACEQLRQEPRWSSSGHNAMTLVKYRDLRIVLEVMRPGAGMHDPTPEVDGGVVIQTLSGRLRLDVEGQPLELGAGRLVALDHMMPSQIQALEESAFLIWIAWTERAAQAG